MSERIRPGGLKITYATTYDPGDVRAWSGTVYHVAQALEGRGVAMDYLGELGRSQVLMNKALNKLAKLSQIGEMFPVERTERMADLFARRIRQHLLHSRSDIVFSPGSIPISLLRTKRPKVFYTDATFAGILAADPAFSTYPKRYLAEGHRLEQAALKNCDLAIYASRWAADSALEHYDVDERKVRVVPFGANLASAPSASSVGRLVRGRSREQCELLFMGVHWKNKGGPKALEAARLLHDGGVPVRLHIVGCEPEVDDLPEWAVVHGFISKETGEGRKKLAALFGMAHFLILPTLADCLGLVFCEASAFGVPSMANDVGGVGEVVKPGVNGHLFPADAPAADWAARIAGLFEDVKAYQALALSSRAAYEQRLNWDVAGSTIEGYLRELV